MAAALSTPTKIITLHGNPIKLGSFDDTVWVSLKSLSAMLNLNYDKQVREISGNTTIASLGMSSASKPGGKMFEELGGEKDFYIPMGDVSLWATKLVMDDLTKIDLQNLCANTLPGIMAKAF